LSSWQAVSASTRLAANAKRFIMGDPAIFDLPDVLPVSSPLTPKSLALTGHYCKRSRDEVMIKGR
jgi:hypothetical protein